MSRVALAILLVLVALVSGCGASASSAGEFEGEEQNVAEVVEQLQSAGQTGDGGEICDELLAEPLRDQIQESGSSCEQELDKALADADDFELEVEDVTISGTNATARVKGRAVDQDRVRELALVREGDDWRITEFG